MKHPWMWWWSILGPFSPKYGSSFLKFQSEVVAYNTKTVSEQSFKIKSIYPWKTQNIAKKQNFPRNYILMTIKYHKSQVSDNSQNYYKIN